MKKDLQEALRRKYWYEMNDKEKIQYLQEELERTQRIVLRIGKFCDMLLNHTHYDRTIMTPIHYNNEQESYGGYGFRVGEFKKS